MDAVSQAASQAAAVEQAAAAAAAAPEAEAEVDPSLQEAEAGEQQEPAAQAATGEPYTLNTNVPMKEMTPERETFVASFAALAPAAGIDAGTAQGLLDAVVYTATMIRYDL